MNWLYLGSMILCGVLSIYDYIKTGIMYKLIYFLFWAYIFVGALILSRITSNNVIQSLYMIVGIIPMMMFIYWDLKKTKKGK